MELNLSWDLFILVFFFIIVAYSVMIGKDQTIKVILSSYVAILASDATGNLIHSMISGGGGVSQLINVPSDSKAITLVKITLFVILTVALTTRGAFEILVAEDKSYILRNMMVFAYGILSAGLIVSTILVYISGASLIATAGFLTPNPIQEIAAGSRMVQMIVNNYAIWFSLPAIAFVISSLFGRED